MMQNFINLFIIFSVQETFDCWQTIDWWQVTVRISLILNPTIPRNDDSENNGILVPDLDST